MRHHLLSILGMTFVLGACSTSPSRVESQAPGRTAVIQGQAQSAQSAQALVQVAGQLEQDGAAPAQVHDALLQAARVFTQQQQCDAALKIITLLEPELQSVQLGTRATLIKAQCELQSAQPDYDKAAALLDKVAPFSAGIPEFAQLQTRVLINQRNWLKAAEMLQFSSADQNMDATQIWQLIQQLTDAELAHATLSNTPVQPYLQLASITRRFALDQNALRQEVRNWQARYPNHPLQLQLPEEIQSALALSPRASRRIAVLLPLTGRLANQGQAIRDGILAAYFSAQQQLQPEQQGTLPDIQFFNSALRSAQDMAELVSTFDTVIGPLLKDKVTELLPLLLPEQRFIALNRIEPYLIPPQVNGVFFALAPEDEARQLANYIYRQGYKSPVVIASNGGVPTRMVETFELTWSALHGSYRDKRLTVARFDNNDAMRSTVTSVLDVQQSEQRIRQIENMLSPQLYNVPRNRRDIDAFILFATPEQTELLNPIIEASLSPFKREAVPVYATSRSYSQTVSPNTLRDLRNLIFTDMPWMLPDNPEAELADMSASLWPQRNSVLKRLFAMGYDAYNLTRSAEMLAALPYSSHKGLSGDLSIPGSGMIQRRLSMGRITEEGVQRLDLD